MDISAASSLSSYSYQTALASSGQSKAVLQALTKAYTTNYGGSSASATDALASLAGQANLRPLVSAIYAASKGDGTSTAISGMTAAQMYGGLDTTSASSLLSGLLSEKGSGLQGFEAATTSATSLAAAASDARSTYGTGTLTTAARALAASETSTTGSTPGATPSTTAFQAALAAQLAAVNNTFTLLA